MKVKKTYLVTTVLFSIGLFFVYIVPNLVEDFYYSFFSSKQQKIFYLNSYYSNLTALGFGLISSSIILFALLKEKVLKQKNITYISLIAFVFVLGFVISSIFVFFKPINDRMGYLVNKKTKTVDFYTGFHVKDKVFFIKKETVSYEKESNFTNK